MTSHEISMVSGSIFAFVLILIRLPRACQVVRKWQQTGIPKPQNWGGPCASGYLNFIAFCLLTYFPLMSLVLPFFSNIPLLTHISVGLTSWYLWLETCLFFTTPAEKGTPCSVMSGVTIREI